MAMAAEWEKWDFTGLDRRIEQALGHFRKDFTGVISREQLGPKYGGYGSFLPMYKIQPKAPRLLPPKPTTFTNLAVEKELRKPAVEKVAQEPAVEKVAQKLAVEKSPAMLLPAISMVCIGPLKFRFVLGSGKGKQTNEKAATNSGDVNGILNSVLGAGKSKLVSPLDDRFRRLARKSRAATDKSSKTEPARFACKRKAENDDYRYSETYARCKIPRLGSYVYGRQGMAW